MRGCIVRRGKKSWRLKFDLDRDPETGARRYHTVTVRGTRRDAEAELARLLNDANKGALVDVSKLTVADYLSRWLDGKHGISPVTRERYRDTIIKGIGPDLGEIELQKLKPVHIKALLSKMVTRGSRTSGPLSARTVRNANRVLHGALKAVKLDLAARNVADAVSPPAGSVDEIEILNADQVTGVLASLKGSRLYPIASLALATGMRRGELLALRWQDVDLANATIKVERSLEQTRGGALRFKSPKTRHSRRTISLPPSAVTLLRGHRQAQLELRLQLGMGKLESDAVVFCNHDGAPISPNCFSVMWGRAVPQATFHALRHTHTSALIAGGIDVVTVSRRLGHSNPTITLGVYAHLFRETDTSAAAAIEKVLG
jgi:integrase